MFYIISLSACLFYLVNKKKKKNAIYFFISREAVVVASVVVTAVVAVFQICPQIYKILHLLYQELQQSQVVLLRLN